MVSYKTTNDPFINDLDGICRFFSIGRPQDYEKEKDILGFHSSFFVYVKTSRGAFKIKFSPPGAAPRIAIEYAINRILVKNHFPTPVMHTGSGEQAFYPCNKLLATCHSYLDGLPAWQYIKQGQKIPYQAMNTTLLSLKNILSASMGPIATEKKEGFVSMINALLKSSRAMAPYKHKAIVDASLLEACLAYQRHPGSFARQWVHNDANLNNFLICQKTVYMLDLKHIQHTYRLSDLASLIVSCMSHKIAATKTRDIVDDYLARHHMDPENLLALNSLMKIKMIKEYLEDIRGEESDKLLTYPVEYQKTYQSHLERRQKSMAGLIAKLQPKAKDDLPQNLLIHPALLVRDR